MSGSNRIDWAKIERWIAPKSRVLDLGCGDGSLLRQLMDSRQVQAYGLEISPDLVTECICKGVNVIEHNLDHGLDDFETDSFDTVVMTQALQALHRPDLVIDEMLRVGKECIVTFPNFGNWHARAYLTLRGRMPVTKQLSYQWYDTPNIHFCTVRDFEALCADRSIRLLHRAVVAERFPDRILKNMWPNLFTETAIYHLSK